MTDQEPFFCQSLSVDRPLVLALNHFGKEKVINENFKFELTFVSAQ